MKKIFLFLLLNLICCGICRAQTAQYAADGENGPAIYELQDQSVLDGSDVVKPLEKELSAQEQLQENNSSFENVGMEESVPELMCDNPKLKEQVKDFIYQHINKVGTNSVIEKRNRILLVKNLHELQQIDEEQLQGKDSFATSAMIAYLRINDKKNIYKICQSSGNSTKEFANLYIIIYKYARFYYVVVSNLSLSSDDLEEATFIFNW